MAQAQPIPQSLSHLVALNVEYGVLICVGGHKYKYALKPIAIARHLRGQAPDPIELQKQVDQYVGEFPFAYDYASVPFKKESLNALALSIDRQRTAILALSASHRMF